MVEPFAARTGTVPTVYDPADTPVLTTMARGAIDQC